jgi:hypothetical protein
MRKLGSDNFGDASSSTISSLGSFFSFLEVTFYLMIPSMSVFLMYLAGNELLFEIICIL